MSSSEEKNRAAIAEQAGAWFVANDEAPLDAQDSAALAAWFKASPVHIEEFLGVSAVARDLKQARVDPDYTLDAILARARANDEGSVRRLWPLSIRDGRATSIGRWFPAAIAVGVTALLCISVLYFRGARPPEHTIVPDGVTALHFETRRGEQLTRRLADNSILHLNTDSAVIVRFTKSRRLVDLRSGQATFEVTHDASRTFQVSAGSAEVVDVGTKFDVQLDQASTIVTVIEGRAAVRPRISGQNRSLFPIEMRADQQVRVDEGVWPVTPVAVDAKRTIAWLHQQIAFDNEPLERVAAEYSRYTTKSIEIPSPALRKLRISGVFATDDIDAFVAFLRSLKGVRVEVTGTRILVLGADAAN